MPHLRRSSLLVSKRGNDLGPHRQTGWYGRLRRHRARFLGMALNGTGWQHLRRSSSPISKSRNDLGPHRQTGWYSRQRRRRARSPGMALNDTGWQHLRHGSIPGNILHIGAEINSAVHCLKVFIPDLQARKRLSTRVPNGLVQSPSAMAWAIDSGVPERSFAHYGSLRGLAQSAAKWPHFPGSGGAAPAVFESSERGCRPVPGAPRRSSHALGFSRSARSPARKASKGTLNGAGNYTLRSCTQSLSGFEARGSAASKIARRCRR